MLAQQSSPPLIIAASAASGERRCRLNGIQDRRDRIHAKIKRLRLRRLTKRKRRGNSLTCSFRCRGRSLDSVRACVRTRSKRRPRNLHSPLLLSPAPPPPCPFFFLASTRIQQVQWGSWPILFWCTLLYVMTEVFLSE